MHELHTYLRASSSLDNVDPAVSGGLTLADLRLHRHLIANVLVAGGERGEQKEAHTKTIHFGSRLWQNQLTNENVSGGYTRGYWGQANIGRMVECDKSSFSKFVVKMD